MDLSYDLITHIAKFSQGEYPYRTALKWREVSKDLGTYVAKQLLPAHVKPYSIAWHSVRSHSGIVKLLLDIGAPVERLYDNDPNTEPLSLAAVNRNSYDCLHALLPYYSHKPRAITRALEICCGCGNFRSVKRILYEPGVRINATGLRYTPLQAAARENHVRVVKLLLYSKASIHVARFEGTVLHVAAEKGSTECARILLEEGAHVNSMKNDLTPLHLAALGGHADTVSLLIDHRADTTLVSHRLMTALHMASDLAHDDASLPTVLALLPHSDVCGVDDLGRTCAHLAAKKGNTRALERLLSAKADPNAVCDRGTTPLHEGVHDHATVETLLKHGASPNSSDQHKHTPVHLAVRRHNSGVLVSLLNAKGDALCKNSLDETPMTISILTRDAHSFMRLRAAVSPETLKPLHESFLRLAYDVDAATIFAFLIPKEARVEWLWKASSDGKHNIVNELLTRPETSIDAKDEDGNTLLHRAAMGGHVSTCEWLLHNGADKWVADPDGKLPIHVVPTTIPDIKTGSESYWDCQK